MGVQLWIFYVGGRPKDDNEMERVVCNRLPPVSCGKPVLLQGYHYQGGTEKSVLF